MHLTYENFHCDVTDAVNDHATAASALSQAVTLQQLNPGLGDLSGLVSKLLKFKKKITPGPLKKLVDLEGKVLQVVGKNAKFIAPIAAFIPVVGWIVGAAVAVVGADYARAEQKAAELKAAAAQGEDLVRQYQAMAGTVPGRMIGSAALRDIFKAWFDQRVFAHPHPAELRDPAADAVVRVTSEAVRRGIARGATSLGDIYDNDLVQVLAESPPSGQPNSDQWIQPQTSAEAQLLIDFMDMALFQQAPQSAITYGVKTVPVDAAPSAPAASTTTAPTASAPTQSAQPVSVPAQSAEWVKIGDEGQSFTLDKQRSVRYGANGKWTERFLSGTIKIDNNTFGDPIVGVVKAAYINTAEGTASSTAPAVSTATPSAPAQPTISADVNSDMLEAMKMMIEQGQSADAATKNILAALANKQVSATPTQTAAIKAAATQVAAGQPVTAGSSASTNTMLVLGAAALVFALARPAKRGKAK